MLLLLSQWLTLITQSPLRTGSGYILAALAQLVEKRRRSAHSEMPVT